LLYWSITMLNEDFTQWPHATEQGPDYVAVVIEWAGAAPMVTPVSQPRRELASLAPSLKKLAIGAGALGALLVAGWGIHRLRHA
jgi:hypothetical protein